MYDLRFHEISHETWRPPWHIATYSYSPCHLHYIFSNWGYRTDEGVIDITVRAMGIGHYNCSPTPSLIKKCTCLGNSSYIRAITETFIKVMLQVNDILSGILHVHHISAKVIDFSVQRLKRIRYQQRRLRNLNRCTIIPRSVGTFKLVFAAEYRYEPVSNTKNGAGVLSAVYFLCILWNSTVLSLA